MAVKCGFFLIIFCHGNTMYLAVSILIWQANARFRTRF